MIGRSLFDMERGDNKMTHYKMSNSEYQLPSSDELAAELERPCFGGTGCA